MIKPLILPVVALATFLIAAPGKADGPAPKGTEFPLFVDDADPAPTDDNTVLCNWNILQSPGVSTTSSVNEFLETWALKRISCEVAIPLGQGHDSRGSRLGLTEPEVKDLVRATSGNSNLGWWELPRDMRAWLPREIGVLSDYTAWTRAYDPQKRPTYETIPNQRGMTHFTAAAAADVIGALPFGEATQPMPNAWIRYRMQDCCVAGIKQAGKTIGTNYLAGEKLPVAVLFFGKEPDGSLPTPEQSYHDFWSAIASGAMGIGVHSYSYTMHKVPKLAENLEELNLAASQITGPAQLGKVLLNGETCTDVGFKILSGPARTVTFTPPDSKKPVDYPSLNVLCKRHDGHFYVIAVNSTDQPVTAEINNLQSSDPVARVLFQGRTVELNHGRFEDKFPAWGVNIYKIH